MVLRSLSRSTPQAFITRAASGSSIEREKEMFEGRKLVLALVRLPESVVDCGFQGTRKRGHSPRPSGLNPPASSGPAWAGALTVTRSPVKLRFDPQRFKGDYALRRPKAQKNCSDVAAPGDPILLAPAQKESLRRRTSAKTWASGNPSEAQPGLEIAVSDPQERVRRPFEVQPRRHRRADHLPHRGNLLRPLRAARGSPDPPRARSGRCSRRTRGRNTPASRPAVPPSSSRLSHICSGVPSNSRPHPITIRLSAENGASVLRELVGDVPDRVAGHVEHPRHALADRDRVALGERDVERRQPPAVRRRACDLRRRAPSRSASTPSIWSPWWWVIRMRSSAQPFPFSAASIAAASGASTRPTVAGRCVAEEIGIVVAETRDGDDLERHGLPPGRFRGAA